MVVELLVADCELVDVNARGDLYPLGSVQAAALVEVDECCVYLVLNRVSCACSRREGVEGGRGLEGGRGWEGGRRGWEGGRREWREGGSGGRETERRGGIQRERKKSNYSIVLQHHSCPISPVSTTATQ